MDAAQVGDRKRVEQTQITREEWKMRESGCDSPCPLEGHWSFGLVDEGYSLVGEYEIDDNTTLFRWEINESKRKPRTDDYLWAHWMNIYLHHDSKAPPKQAYVPETKKCPTCGKPI